LTFIVLSTTKLPSFANSKASFKNSVEGETPAPTTTKSHGILSPLFKTKAVHFPLAIELIN